MTLQIKQFLLQLLVFSLLLPMGCGTNSNGVDPEERLCGGEPGFAAPILGMPEPIEMCVSNEQTIATYQQRPGGEEAQFTSVATFPTDDLSIEVEIRFFVHSTFPVSLSPTTNDALAESDPGSVLFYYRETKPGVYDYESVAISGVFTLTFSDPDVAVATFSALDIELEDIATGEPVGTRTISEGYLSVTADQP